ELATLLPDKSVVTIVASPSRGMEATVGLALELADQGHEAVPHLSARMIKDRAELASIVERLRGGGIDHVLVVGGDSKDPGAYPDALSLLRDMEELGHHFEQVGITGYPEGHPLIDDETLLRSLLDKQPHATYIATQMCFQSRTITGWVEAMRGVGVTLPVKVGVPGVVATAKLIGLAAKIGVGDSARYLAKSGRSMFRLLRPVAYRPDRLLRGIAPGAEGLGIEGLHIFTFNQLAPTLEWYEREKGV
ncbi:MAG: methylenetetrahydrofolate reductase, partial [Actinobacteria bacterium]|nr:methylenetetrahydrofolate reductase [Actinomycetota bacterium]